MATVMNLQSPWSNAMYPPPTPGPSHTYVRSYPPTPALSPEILLAQGRALPPHSTYMQQLVTPGYYPPYEVDKTMFSAEIKSRQRTSQQNRDVLEYWFRRYDKPFGDLRTGLLKECNMEPRTLQVWFQNRRSKEKALRRKARKKAKVEWMEKYKLQPPPHEDDSDFECEESEDEPSTGSEEEERGKRRVKKKLRRRDDIRWATLLPVGPGENPGSSAVLRNFPVPMGFPFRERNYDIPPPDVLRAQGWPLLELGVKRRASLANGEAARIATPQHQATSARRGSVPYAHAGAWPFQRPLVKMATQNYRRASTPVLHNQYPVTPIRNVSRHLAPIKDHEEHLLTTLNPTASTYTDFSSLTESPADYAPLPNPHFAFGSAPGNNAYEDVPRWGYRDRLGSVASEWTVTTETPTDAPTEESFDMPYGFHGDIRRASAPAGMVNGIQQLSVRPNRPSPLSANSFGETYEHVRGSSGASVHLQSYGASPMAPPMSTTMSHDSGLPVQTDPYPSDVSPIAPYHPQPQLTPYGQYTGNYAVLDTPPVQYDPYGYYPPSSEPHARQTTDEGLAMLIADPERYLGTDPSPST